MVFRRPFPVLRGQLFYKRLVPGCQIFLFRPVPDVVHLPGASVGGHQLELTCQGRPVSLMFPEDSAGRAGIGNEVPHLGRRKFRRIIPVGVERLAVHMGRNWESGPRKAGWGDVLEQERRVVARFRTYFGK